MLIENALKRHFFMFKVGLKLYTILLKVGNISRAMLWGIGVTKS
jgi:hypothetical protein